MQLDKDIASFMPKQTGFVKVNCHDTYDFLAALILFNDYCPPSTRKRYGG